MKIYYGQSANVLTESKAESASKLSKGDGENIYFQFTQEEEDGC